MNKEESIQQIETLIEAWQLDEADLNQTDINAMQALLKENQELKKQLEKWNKQLKFAEEMITIQKQDGNYNYDEYMLGMYNGMEYIASLFRINEPKIISGKDIKFLHNSHENQQKEFIKYLEDEKDRLIKETSHYYIDGFDRQHSVNETIYDEVDVILQKYRSITGVSDEKK